MNYQPFITGEKICLREVRPSDVNENYYNWMNDPVVTAYLESRYYPNSIEFLTEYVRKLDGDRNTIFLAIVLKENSKHIGNIKLGPINWINRIGDIGILIGVKNCWGKGYASGAIKLMSQYAFNTLNLHKITAGCFESNKGAVKAFQKSGFAREGVLEEHYYCNGEYRDITLLGLINRKRNDSETN